jgi:hypothetical protein
MEALKERAQRGSPEQLVYRLVKKLSYHVFWDALLIVLPPLIVVLYCLFYLSFSSWLSPFSAVLLASAALMLGALAIVIRYRPNVPSLRVAARLIDERTAAQDRFLTLATLQPSPDTAFFVSRLRWEAAGLQSRIALKREFPYRIKRPVYSSVLASLIAGLLFHLLLPLAHSTLRPQPAHERLRELASQMASRPNLKEIARALHTLIPKLEDPKTPLQEKRDLAQAQRKKIEEQEKNQTQKQDRDLLSEAAGTLEGIEKQAGAGEHRKDQENGAGGIRSNVPQQGKGEGQQSEGSGGDGSKGEQNAPSKSEMHDGQMAQGKLNQEGKEKHQGEKSGGNESQPDPNNSSKDQSKQGPGKADSSGANQDGQNKVPEEIPQTPPPERFYKPGEGGYSGIKGAGYVTVQLPEELEAQGKGSGQKKDAKSGKSAGSQVPVSNVPLPKHVPDAPSEKQQMPLEYRGIIR